MHVEQECRQGRLALAQALTKRLLGLATPILSCASASMKPLAVLTGMRARLLAVLTERRAKPKPLAVLPGRRWRVVALQTRHWMGRPAGRRDSPDGRVPSAGRR